MPIFTIPADFKIESIKKILVLNKNCKYKVKESYGSLRNSEIGSGRKYFELPDVSYDDLKTYVQECNKNDIDFNYTLNLSCYDNNEFTEHGKEKLLSYIKKLVDCGIRHFTIAMPSLIELLMNHFPEVKVTLSVITGIDSLSKIERFVKFKNIKNIYLHEKIYRNLFLVKKITDIAHKNDVKVGVIVNSFCLSDCPFRNYHYNFGAHATNGSSYIIPEYYGSLCALMKIADKRNVLNAPWIRPNDLEKYVKCGVDRFKISGREMHTNGADIPKVVEIYNRGEFSENLAELFMCFTKCPYSEIFNIKNDENLNNYLEDVFAGRNKCNLFGCTNCMKCKNALSSIEINEVNKEKWSKIFNDRITKFKE
ncbi:MAG: hypothetical protein EOM55_02020 [Clostridia bacterium]|nr:hypothetical protein [Clostridia bacterium]